MKVVSRTLDTWKEELVKERIDYYNSKKELFDYINNIYKTISQTVRDESDKLYNRNRTYEDNHYEELYQIMLEKEIYYDREHFIRTGNNGTRYYIMFDDKKLYNSFQGITEDRHKRLYAYSLTEYYFLNYESKSLYKFLDKYNLDIEKESIREVDRYVQKLLDRIEKNYGKVLNVKDSYRGNVESVEFECEEGNCYLERILAGGYNIQRLHNRILVKEVK